MPNLRIIHANYIDQATSLAASTTSGSLAAALMRTDNKGEAHRSTGTSVTYTATWTGGVSVGGVALPATNLSAAATIRARAYSNTACTALLADTGAITACPGLPAGPWTWQGTFNVNAFAYGYFSKAVAWFASNLAGVKGLVVDLSDAGNPAGYIDCARLIAGPWWSPAWNPEYGAPASLVDDSTNTRSDAGDLKTDRAPMHEELSVKLPWLTETERSALRQVMRANGIWKPVFLSLMPGDGRACEQDYMIYGKRKNAAFEHPVFEQFAHTLDIEGW